MKVSERHSSLLILFASLLGLVAVYIALRPGLGVDFHFDAFPNLRLLREVSDLESALFFVFSGGSGPLGRPVALATFLLHQSAWPHDSEPFLFGNVLIHLINGVLLFIFSFLVARGLKISRNHSLAAAAITSLVWLISPILLSTTFSVIQRMTSLAAVFMLLGVVGHLLIRQSSALSDRSRLLLMTTNISLFTALAALSKENGLLLPVLVLVLELTVLPRASWSNHRWWRIWHAVFLWVPLILILGYLLSRVDYSEGVVAYRGFTTEERLLTQSVILWEYLYHALLPATHNIGFFHDDYVPERSLFSPRVLMASIAWLAVTALAIWKRRRWPLFALGVLWYLAGHLIESTVVPLELYFEHRNYVPLMGVFMAVAIGVVGLPRIIARAALAVVVVYFSVLFVVAIATVNLWASRNDAANFWLQNKPTSERAVLYYVRRQLISRNPIAAVEALELAKNDIDAEPYLTLWQLRIQCQFDELQKEFDFSNILDQLSEAEFRFGTVTVLGDLYTLVGRSQCSNIRQGEILEAALILLENKHYRHRSTAQYELNRLAANYYYDNGQRREAIAHYEDAALAGMNVPITIRLNQLYEEFELYKRGCRFYQTLIDSAPRHPVTANRWIGNLRARMRQLGSASPYGDCRMIPEAKDALVPE